MRRYNTSIKSITQARSSYFHETGTSPIFLSDWDSDYNSIHMPNLALNSVQLSDVQKYYFWTDEEGYRDTIQNFFSNQYSISLQKDSFTIGSNGTSGIMLTLSSLKEAGRHSALVVTPVYFSTLNLLDELDFNVVEYRLCASDNFSLRIDIIENYFVSDSVDTLIITNPLFGCGIELSTDTIKSIVALCNKHNICLVMDYVYGGMPWNISNPSHYVFNSPVFQAVSSAEHYVFIESISKRVFLNGAKFALVFASPKIMKRILRLSVFMVGSMAQQQVNLVPQIYSLASSRSLTSLIAENAKLAQNRYKMIKAILSDTRAVISDANCGYFALLSVPNTEESDDIQFALDILKKTGVLTTPHSRYLHREEGLYSFRVNLLLDQQCLIDGITKIGNLE